MCPNKSRVSSIVSPNRLVTSLSVKSEYSMLVQCTVISPHARYNKSHEQQEQAAYRAVRGRGHRARFFGAVVDEKRLRGFVCGCERNAGKPFAHTRLVSYPHHRRYGPAPMGSPRRCVFGA